MNYKSVVITKQGGPDVLQVTENPLRAPQANEVRVRIHYSSVGATDILMRYGYYMYAPKIPFAPGYEMIGIVDAVGADVTDFRVGQRVAALTVHGGYAEYIYLPPSELVVVPDGLELTEALTLVLNYVTAYQMLHRVAQIKPGQSILITGASGGVGTALLQLGRLSNLKMYGLASRAKHELVTRLGGIPIDYRQENIAATLRAHEPKGFDAVFECVSAASAWRGYKLLRRGGILVSFGIMGSIQNGHADNLAAMRGYLLPMLLNLIPNGKRATFYGITKWYKENPTPFREDLPKLFELLAQRKIQPVIAAILPLDEAARANAMLERGEVAGKLLLKCA